jgi:hypothetical protein
MHPSFETASGSIGPSPATISEASTKRRATFVALLFCSLYVADLVRPHLRHGLHGVHGPTTNNGRLSCQDGTCFEFTREYLVFTLSTLDNWTPFRQLYVTKARGSREDHLEGPGRSLFNNAATLNWVKRKENHESMIIYPCPVRGDGAARSGQWVGHARCRDGRCQHNDNHGVAIGRQTCGARHNYIGWNLMHGNRYIPMYGNTPSHNQEGVGLNKVRR